MARRTLRYESLENRALMAGIAPTDLASAPTDPTEIDLPRTLGKRTDLALELENIDEFFTEFELQAGDGSATPSQDGSDLLIWNNGDGLDSQPLSVDDLGSNWLPSPCARASGRQ